MATFSYNGYTLNGYLGTPSYDTEIALFKAIIDQLPTAGTTSVTTQHHHSKLSSPTADVAALTVSESGILNMPLLAAVRGVVVKNAAGDVGITGGILGFVNSPGNDQLLIGGVTGVGGISQVSGTYVMTPGDGQVVVGGSTGIDGATGALYIERGAATADVYTTPTTIVTGLSVINSDNLGLTGIGAQTTGIWAIYRRTGRVLDYWFHVGGYANGNIFQLNAPGGFYGDTGLNALSGNISLIRCIDDVSGSWSVGVAKAGTTLIDLYPDVSMGTWPTGAYRCAEGHITYLTM